MFVKSFSNSGTGFRSRQVVAAALAFASVVSSGRCWALPHISVDGLPLKLSMNLQSIPAMAGQTPPPSHELNGLCPRRAEPIAHATGNASLGTLQESVERAALSNPEIARAQSQLRKAHADVDTAGSAYSPQLRFNASSGTNGAARTGLASAANVQLSKLLHDFGKTDSLIEEARKREEARTQEHRETVNRVTLEIVEAWLNVARQSEMARLHQQASSALHEAIRILRLRVEAGLAGSGDVELAQARLSQTRAAGITACLQREQLLSRLSMLTGGPIDDRSMAAPEALMGNGPTSGWDPSALPGVRQAAAEHQAAVHHAQSVKAARWPSVYVQATRSTGHQPDSARSINLTLSMDVLEAGLNSRIESAGAEVQAARLRVQFARDTAEDSFRRIHAELQSIDMRRPLLTSQALSTAATRRNFMDQFLAGRRQVLDLLNTHQEVLAAEIALASLGYDRMVLVARLHGLHDELFEMMTPSPVTPSSSVAGAVKGARNFSAPPTANADNNPDRMP